MARRGNQVTNGEYKPRSKAERAHAGEFGISVYPSMCGQGIRIKLLRAIEDWAGNNGIDKIDFQVWFNNTTGITLYTEAGFSKEGVREGAVRRRW